MLKYNWSINANNLESEVDNYFVEPELYSSIEARGNCFIKGTRGTGKTLTLMKMALEYNNPQDYWEDRDYLGCKIEYRPYCDLELNLLDVDIKLYFCESIMAVIITKSIIETLSILLNKNIISSSEIDSLLNQVKVEDIIEIYNTHMDYLKRVSFIAEDDAEQRCDISYIKRLHMQSCSMLMKTIDIVNNFLLFHKKSLYVLIDEYDNYGFMQKSVIRIIKRLPRNTYYKIAIIPYGLNKYEEEDYCGFDTYSIESGVDKKFLAQIFLKLVNQEDESYINNLLPSIKPEQEVAMLLKEKVPNYLSVLSFKLEQLFDSNTSKRYFDILTRPSNHLFGRYNLFMLDTGVNVEYLIELIISKAEIYERTYEDSKVNILNMLCKENNLERIYCGFDTICYFSSRNIRQLLYIIQNMLDSHNEFSSSIDILSQNEALKLISNQYYFDQQYKFDEELRSETKAIINSFARIFYELNGRGFDYIFFRTSGTLSSDNANRLFAKLLQYAVIQTRQPMSKYPNVEFSLNKFLCPAFQIAFKGERTLTLSPEDLEIILTGPEEERHNTENRIIKENIRHSTHQPINVENKIDNTDIIYDLAISFADENRDVAESIASQISELGYKVFYDEYEQADMWGKDLYEHLISIYRDKSRFCLMIISDYYIRKNWTNHERKAAQERAFRERKEYILPLRLDNTDVPGFLSTTGFLDLRKATIQTVVEIISSKLAKVI